MFNTVPIPYYYSTVDGVITTHSKIYETNYQEYMQVHFEKPCDTGFKIADAFLPSYNFVRVMGFDEDELFELEDYLKLNAFLLWELAREHTEEV